MRLSVSELAQAKYVTTAFNSKTNYEKLASVVHVLQNRGTWSFHSVILQRTAKKCAKIYNARAQPLICSSSLLFCSVLAAVAVVVYFKVPIITCNGRPCRESW